MHQLARRSARHRRGDEGVSLIEVMVAFTILMIALIPLSYLFTTAIIQAGQSKNQQTALSIAEKWTEILSNLNPPANSYGEVIVDSNNAPVGPASGSTTTTASYSVNSVMTTPTSIVVAGTATLAAATVAIPQTVVITTSAGPDTITYTGQTYSGSNIVSLTGIQGWSTAGETIANGAAISQTSAVTPTELKGGTTYSLQAEYEWSSVQNGTMGTTTVSTAATIPANLALSTLTVASTSSFASSGSANVTTSAGTQTVNYSGITSTTLTGITGWTAAGAISSGAAVIQRVSKPNLCASGTPQLLKLRMTVGWGPNSDVNNVQDSIIINYPPAGIQTLGFIALQMSGNTTANDSQGDPWNLRVQAPPVQIVQTSGGSQTLTIYPDNYGCAFAQVRPGTYTVTVSNASSGIPAGTTYGNPSFVANTAGILSGHLLQQPTTEQQTGIPVAIGAVTNLNANYPTAFPGYDQGSSINLSYPSSSAFDDGVSCPGAGTITCVATGQNGAGADLAWANQSAWSNVTVPGTVARIASVACAGAVECVGVGYGGGKGIILDGSTGANPAATAAPNATTALTGVTSLSQVACPSANNCVAIGTSSTGAVVLSDTITTGIDSWTAATLPAAITGLTTLTCPTGGTGCVALGTTSTGGNGTPIVVSGGFGGTWVADTTYTGFTLSSLSSLACPAAATCLATGVGKIGAGTTGPIVINGIAPSGLAASAVGWTADTLPTIASTTINALTGITCPPSSPKCLFTGTGTKVTSVPLVLFGPLTASAALTNDPLPAAVASLSQTVCPSSGVCVSIGSTTSVPAAPTILSWTINAVGTADTPLTATINPPSGTLSQLTQVNCPSTSTCAVTGVNTSTSNQPSAFLLASNGGTSTFNPIALPSANPALYLSDIDCTTLGSPVYCSAVGSGATGAVAFSSNSGPSGPWSDQTPAGLAGAVVQGLPVELNNNGLLPSSYANVVTAGASPNVTLLPDLFPFNSGYALFAGDCSAELGAGGFNQAQASTIPGGTSSATIPLGLIQVRALHLSGTGISLPYAGATFSLTATSCSADTYILPAAGPDGLSRIDVPYGTYNLTVTGASATTVSVTVGGSSLALAGATIPYPNPISVSVP